MMNNFGVQGGTYQELRPFHLDSPPVFPNLVDTLCAVPRFAYDPTAAYVCAVLSGWAYSDPQVVSTMMVRLGLERNRCRYIELLNDAMFICSKAYFVQSACGRLGLLAYRGTEPVNLVSWLTDADVKPVTVPFAGPAPAPGEEPTIHGGFYRNQRATWFDVERALALALDGRSVLSSLPIRTNTGEPPPPAPPPEIADLEALYVAGHSLGGAMAAIAAFRLAHNAQPRSRLASIVEKIRGVYTFGQPMVGNEEWAQLCRSDPRYDVLTQGLFRHVFENDPVPSLPPIEAGTFEHSGREYRSEELPGGRDHHWAAHPGPARPQMPLVDLPRAFVGFVEAELQGWKHRGKGRSLLRALVSNGEIGFARLLRGPYSIYDHLPTNYLACSELSQRAVVTNEFGDF